MTHHDRYEELRDALNAGPKAGNLPPNAKAQRMTNALFLSACTPETIAALLAERDTLMADAERYRWLRDHECCELILTHDGDHACNYMTASEWIDDNAKDFADDSPEEVQRMRDTNTIWRLQVYPNTPIGFWAIHGATLDAAIDAARSEGKEGSE